MYPVNFLSHIPKYGHSIVIIFNIWQSIFIFCREEVLGSAKIIRKLFTHFGYLGFIH